MKDFNSIGLVVPRVLEKIGVTAQNFALTSLIEEQLSQISSTARIVGFKNNKIFIEVESPVELHELTFKKREILKMVQDAFPKNSVQQMPEIKLFLRGMARPGIRERNFFKKNETKKHSFFINHS